MNAPVMSVTLAVGHGTGLDRTQIAAIYLCGYKNTAATDAASAAVTRSCSSTATVHSPPPTSL